uniref:SAP30 binding protein n=1 Tax=Sarcophilus harrisii TaxID=9305 RepID=A0A7N4P6J2_SARHA
MAGKKNVLSSLAVYAEDSEPESDSEAGVEAAGSATAAEEKGGLVSEAYGDDDFSRLEGDEDGYEEEDEENSRQSEFSELEKRDPQELVASFSERVRNMSPDEIKIPPEPPGRCSNHLQDKIQKLYERKIKEGMDMNYIIQRKKEFRNPSIYEKLIQYCSIDELGTNYPKDMFDPHGWSEDSYYEALAKAQKIEMDKLEKAKKERTKAYCRDVSAAPGEVTGAVLPLCRHHLLLGVRRRGLAKWFWACEVGQCGREVWDLC